MLKKPRSKIQFELNIIALHMGMCEVFWRKLDFEGYAYAILNFFITVQIKDLMDTKEYTKWKFQPLPRTGY